MADTNKKAEDVALQVTKALGEYTDEYEAITPQQKERFSELSETIAESACATTENSKFTPEGVVLLSFVLTAFAKQPRN